MHIMGKTTLLLNDIYNVKAQAFIDPHGDAAEKLLDHIPSQRIKDVIYFNPADREQSISLNVLEKVPSNRKHLVASHLISSFKRLEAEECAVQEPEYVEVEKEHLVACHMAKYAIYGVIVGTFFGVHAPTYSLIFILIAVSVYDVFFAGWVCTRTVKNPRDSSNRMRIIIAFESLETGLGDIIFYSILTSHALKTLT